MFAKLELTRMAQDLAAHAGARMGVIAQNIANADTPGYRTRDIADFATLLANGPQEMRSSRPGHLKEASERGPYQPFHSGGDAAPNGNDVSLELEMVKSASTRQEHEMALAIYRATSGVIRASLGSRG